MKKEITVGQFLSVAATLLIAMATGWITINNKVASHAVRLQGVEARQDKTERILERIEGKIELILINLQNKKDR